MRIWGKTCRLIMFYLSNKWNSDLQNFWGFFWFFYNLSIITFILYLAQVAHKGWFSSDMAFYYNYVQHKTVAFCYDTAEFNIIYLGDCEVKVIAKFNCMLLLLLNTCHVFFFRRTYSAVENSLAKHACQKSQPNFVQLLKHRQKTILFINNGSVTCTSLKTLEGYFRFLLSSTLFTI